MLFTGSNILSYVNFNLVHLIISTFVGYYIDHGIECWVSKEVEMSWEKMFGSAMLWTLELYLGK
jgi:hypothetical protein